MAENPDGAISRLPNELAEQLVDEHSGASGSIVDLATKPHLQFRETLADIGAEPEIADIDTECCWSEEQLQVVMQAELDHAESVLQDFGHALQCGPQSAGLSLAPKPRSHGLVSIQEDELLEPEAVIADDSCMNGAETRGSGDSGGREAGEWQSWASQVNELLNGFHNKLAKLEWRMDQLSETCLLKALQANASQPSSEHVLVAKPLGAQTQHVAREEKQTPQGVDAEGVARKGLTQQEDQEAVRDQLRLESKSSSISSQQPSVQESATVQQVETCIAVGALLQEVESELLQETITRCESRNSSVTVAPLTLQSGRDDANAGCESWNSSVTVARITLQSGQENAQVCLTLPNSPASDSARPETVTVEDSTPIVVAVDTAAATPPVAQREATSSPTREDSIEECDTSVLEDITLGSACKISYRADHLADLASPIDWHEVICSSSLPSSGRMPTETSSGRIQGLICPGGHQDLLVPPPSRPSHSQPSAWCWAGSGPRASQLMSTGLSSVEVEVAKREDSKGRVQEKLSPADALKRLNSFLDESRSRLHKKAATPEKATCESFWPP